MVAKVVLIVNGSLGASVPPGVDVRYGDMGVNDDTSIDDFIVMEPGGAKPIKLSELHEKIMTRHKAALEEAALEASKEPGEIDV